MALDDIMEPKFGSVVENFKNENEGYKCGYCKSSSSNCSHGMWAHQLSVHDYQELIDRGWRRSGYYCYKPTMDKICCPMYTIRCNAVDFKPSKSQKKVIKRMNRFLVHGERAKHKGSDGDMNTEEQDEDTGRNSDWIAAQQTAHVATVDKERLAKAKSSLQTFKGGVFDPSEPAFDENVGQLTENLDRMPKNKTEDQETSVGTSTSVKSFKPGDGPNKEKPPCKKAKLLRLERRKQKLSSQGLQLESPTPHQTLSSSPKKLEDFLYPPMSAKAPHRLQLKLVRGDQLASLEQMWQLFAKYQKAIHKQTDEECDTETFQHFLVETPLKAWRPADGSGPPQGYGSFHQQYWLDDKLVAVGVIDILPRCVSSVYFYYDPEYSDLSLGTYGSLREVAFVRTLHTNSPQLKWYYMGFYIHSCPKMRYKAGLYPSMLLCPETYTWHPISQCLVLLDKNKYSRLEPDPAVVDVNADVNLNELVVFYDLRPVYYRRYRELKGNCDESEDEEVLHYARLVGRICAKRILLLR
ncbi:hypothetical protein ONE63_009301 [Megalurothrips usitatus]|uniref:Arginyl-tRNA--protein transferase 1 n=1 Tax=Megalurothrips usitatus TaxID=439358 RepID=A0AAV7XRP5_9NEOP|nr:hypothetical protein ONE63_009301 [Megalurothrips usitatus]